MQDGVVGIDYAHKENFEWISVIRLPDFVTKVDFEWAIEEATKKKLYDSRNSFASSMDIPEKPVMQYFNAWCSSDSSNACQQVATVFLSFRYQGQVICL